MKKLLVTFIFCCTSFYTTAQSGYEITINLKNFNDTIAYLTFYRFDKTLIKDTCTTIKNGKIIFKGKEKLDNGIYSLVSQNKNLLFDFFIDEKTQKLELKSEFGENITKEIVSMNSTLENEFFAYLNYIAQQNKEFLDFKQKTILKTKKDSIILNEKVNEFENRIADYEEKFIAKNKRSLIANVLNLKTEKTLKNIPKASNGRPDSLMVYNYYKTHYWDNVDFKDDAIMRNPFFANKLNRYFEKVVVSHPDSICVEIDRIMQKPTQSSLLYKLMLANLTHTYESSKIMGYDKVFVHIVDNYFKTGKAVGIYDDEEVVQKIIKRADKIRPLLIGNTALELMMIKAEDFHKMKAMGFENAKNNDEMTKVFYDHINEVEKMWVKLSDVNSKYTILVFWDVNCGHCTKEIPILLKSYNELIKDKIDIKVYSVYMQHEGEEYLKYISENNLPWINVYDGAHYNNAVERYDVYSTPVIYILDKNKVIKAKRIDAGNVSTIIKALEQEK